MPSLKNIKRVLTICGVDGVGKTSIAKRLQLLCNEISIQSCIVPLPRYGDNDLFVSTNDPWKIPDSVQHYYWPLWFECLRKRVLIARQENAVVLVERGSPFSLVQISKTPQGQRFLIDYIDRIGGRHWILGETYITVIAPLEVIYKRLLQRERSTHDSQMMNPKLSKQFINNLKMSLIYLKKWHLESGIKFRHIEIPGTGHVEDQQLFKVIKKIIT